MMGSVLTLLGILIPVLAGEQILFWRQIKKVKAAEGTNADVDNSLKLIELQEQYIALIANKDEKIRTLNEELLKTKESLIYYKTTHCTLLGCTKREPPFMKEFEENRNGESVSDNK